MSLSILCVTKALPRTDTFIEHFFDLGHRLGAEVVIAVDGKDVRSKGYIESCLDEAIALTHGDYVLRLDDDERCSPALRAWLERKEYLVEEHWTFPRVHLWRDPKTIILSGAYFPDLQTRLSVRAKAGNRPIIHQGSPYGAGTIARVAIEHWTYLCKSYEERCETCAFYNGMAPGTGRSIEDEMPGEVQFMEYGDGYVPMRGRVWKGTLADPG